jgi:hypothetical protein
VILFPPAEEDVIRDLLVELYTKTRTAWEARSKTGVARNWIETQSFSASHIWKFQITEASVRFHAAWRRISRLLMRGGKLSEDFCAVFKRIWRFR